MEYVPLIDNNLVTASRVKIMPNKETDPHFDASPQVVIAVQGGTITRLEANGTTTDVEFPKGRPVYRPAESRDKTHTSINNGNTPIELIIIQLK